MMQLFFFALSGLVLLAGHILFWYIIVNFFYLNVASGRIIAAGVTIFLFASVVLSSYLIHQRDNLFTRWYYILALSWVGLLVNFGVMAGLIVCVRLIGSFYGFVFPSLYLKIIFLSGGVVLSLVGVWRAWSPRVQEYEVRIKDLPAAWEGKSVAQISDVHLGPIYRQHFLSRLVKRLNNLNPEAIFITGDLFDGMEADFRWLHHPLQNLHAPRGIYYSFGNHDLYLGLDYVSALLKDGPIKILDNKLTIVDGLQIIGINYSFNRDFDLEDTILRQVGYDRKKPSVLLFHAPKNIALARKADIDLQLSGHTHDGQLFPFNLLAKWAHRGYGYGLFRAGDFSLIVNGGVGTWGPPMRTAARGEIVKITWRKK
ncbi:TPA: hypothetical protein DCZ15_01110 [Candidatus Falkowbacteria bacterium]|nr:MAG: Metallophosphoesterase [Candidatus Falkowbacteria bacterium GW2011_GWF2_43_32]HBA36455.1 hypothetical protein [Candidatus Falkowbacteria bacterium]